MAGTEMAAYVPQEQVAALEVRAQVNQLQYLMQQVLKKGEHYGVVPGTKGKPSLLQPGAEKICLMFKLVPRYSVRRTELGGGHREVEVTCTLFQRGSDIVEGEGIGSCSTLESKYRYRTKWENGSKTKVENTDIADVYNTVLKMAKKRALVDAVKSTTAASDIFTQDVEDLPAYMTQAQPAQVVSVEPQQAHASQSAPQEDVDWLRSTVAQIVALGYQEAEVKPYLWQQYKTGGKAAAQEAATGLIAAVPAPEEAQPADEYELAGEDIEF